MKPASRLAVAFWLCLATAVAQQSAAPKAPAADAQVTQIRFGSYAGMCIGYCDTETLIQPGWVRTTSRAFSHRWRYPTRKAQRRLKKADWDRAVAAVEAAQLAGVPATKGCPGCADELVEFLEVQYSDGGKRAFAYNYGEAPPAVAELLGKLKAL